MDVDLVTKVLGAFRDIVVIAGVFGGLAIWLVSTLTAANKATVDARIDALTINLARVEKIGNPPPGTIKT